MTHIIHFMYSNQTASEILNTHTIQTFIPSACGFLFPTADYADGVATFQQCPAGTRSFMRFG